MSTKIVEFLLSIWSSKKALGTDSWDFVATSYSQALNVSLEWDKMSVTDFGNSKSGDVALYVNAENGKKLFAIIIGHVEKQIIYLNEDQRKLDISDFFTQFELYILKEIRTLAVN
jgi:hypothetical protein